MAHLRRTVSDASPSDIERAARDAGVYMYSRVGSALVQMGAFALAARSFGESSFGYLQIVLTVYLLGLALGSLGLPDVVFYFLGRQPGHASAIVRRATFLLATMVVPVIAGAALFVFFGGGKTDVSAFFPYLALMLALELPAQPAVNLMIATGHARLASGLFIGFGGLRAAAVLVPALASGSVELTVQLLTAASVVRLVVYLYLVKVYFPGGKNWWDRKALRHMLSYAAPAGYAAVCGVINAQVDKLVIGWVLGPAAAGQYGVATYELPLVTLVPYAAAAVLQPVFVKLYADQRIEDLRELWKGMVRKVSLAVLPLAVFCIAMAGQLVPTVFSGEYSQARLPFQIYTLILLHRVAAYGNILQALERPRVVLASATIMVGTNLILTVPLTLWLGFPGAALATVIATAPAWWFVMREIADGLRVRTRDVMPWRHYLAVLGLSAAVAGGVATLLYVLHERPGVETAIGAAIYLPVVMILLRVTGLMSRSDQGYLGDWLRLRLLRKQP
jgi:O-antigen/teichoic acid export membrane protein